MNTCDQYNYVKTKVYVESLKNLLANTCLRSLRPLWRPGFEFESCSENVKKEDFKDFEAMTGKKQTFRLVNLSLSRVHKTSF